MTRFKPLPVSILVALALGSGASWAGGAIGVDLPDAKPGECYAKAIIPARYETVKENVVVKEAGERVQVIPARYEWVEEKVRVKDPAYKLISSPALYKTVTEKIETEPERMVWTKGHSARFASPTLVEVAAQVGLNPDARSGQCYAEYLEPAQYRMVEEKVLKREASEKLITTPAKYEWVNEKVLVKDASSRVVSIPAVYETRYEEVMVEPAKQVWKKGQGPVERIDDATGEIMCLVEIPPKYKKVKKRVLVKAATTKEVEIPAVYTTQRTKRLISEPKVERVEVPAVYSTVKRREKVSDSVHSWYLEGSKDAQGKPTGQVLCRKEIPAKHQTVTRKVVETPASTKRVEVPAVYKTVKVRKLVSPAEEKRLTVPAVSKTIVRKSKISDERVEWRRILCKTNMSHDIVTRVQQALYQAGFDPGIIDGILGQDTLRAVSQYQRKNKLARGGLTIATLESLGINI